MTGTSNLGTGGAVNGAIVNGAPTKDVRAIVDGNDSYDMDALKAFSEAETAELEKQHPDWFKPKPSRKEKKEEIKPEAIIDEEAKDEEAGATEDADEEALDSSDEDEAEEEIGGEQEDETEGDLPEAADGEEVDHRKYVLAHDGEKSLKIPKQALVDIKVNGKIEQVPLKEVLNRASGAIHIEKETTRLGQERRALEQNQAKWREKAKTVNENMEMLHELCQTGTPEEVAAYFAHLKGEDPNKIFDSIIQNALKYAAQYEGLTERELNLQNENRKYRLQQFIAKKRAERANAEQAKQNEGQRLNAICKKKNITPEEFHRFSDELSAMSEADIQSMGIEITPESVTDYIVKRKYETVIDGAINAVDKRRASDAEFKGKLSSAVIKTEAILGRVMSPKEIRELVRMAAKTDKKALSETINKKVDRAVKAGATSKNGNSHKQEKTDEGPYTLRDHWDKLRGTN